MIAGTAARRSLLELLQAGLSDKAMHALERAFAAYEVHLGSDRYRVGPVVRASWEKEDTVPTAVAEDMIRLLNDIFDGGSVSSYPSPGCCDDHDKFVQSSFPYPLAYPEEEELLRVLIETIWTLLPQTRGVLSMCVPKPRGTTQSSFMVLNNFVRAHDRQVLNGGMTSATAASRYLRRFRSTRPEKLRQADVKSLVASGDLVGLIGSWPQSHHGAPRPATYCKEPRPFSTPTPSRKTTNRTAPPEEMLAQLGLQFDASRMYVELVYRVALDREGGLAPVPTAPTVIDSRGYWLFRPDRTKPRAGRTIWNYTRDVATNGRGRRELVAPALPMRNLLDIMVWPSPTLAGWNALALPALATDLAAP